MEPLGRFASGVVELVAAVLLLIPALHVYGALLASAVMVGALGSHFAFLGIEVQGDGGLLFVLAWVTLLASLGALWLQRRAIIAQIGRVS